MGKMLIKKKDIISGLVIGELVAVILLLIQRFLELPAIMEQVIVYFPIALPILSLAGIVVAALIGKRLPTFFQMGKNILVGILNSAIDLGILNLLMFVTGRATGYVFLLFKALSFSGASVNSYFWNKLWTFEDRGQGEATEFAKFYSVALGGLLIHEVVINVVVNVVGPQFGISPGLWANVGNVAAIFLGFFWDFFGYKLLVFKD